jgi:ACS family sodium-dependent inorganic phosphate cotransporter
MTSQSVEGRPRRFLLVGLIFLACAIAYTDRVNLAVAAVAMREQFGWSQTDKGMVLASFFVGYLLCMFVAGVLSTRFGGHKVLGWSVLAWSLFTLLTPPAAMLSMPALIAVRIGMGMGEAAMFPAAYELFGRWVPASERTRATSWLFTGIPAGTVLGLSGSGWLIAHYSWSAAFYAFAVLGFAWALWWFRALKNDPASDPRVTAAERALLPAPVTASSESAAPRVSYRQLLLNKPVAGIAAAHFAGTWNVYVLLSWLPSYFREAQGLSLANSGLYSAAPWIAMAIGTNAGARYSDRRIARTGDVNGARKRIQCFGLLGSGTLLVLLQHAHTPEVALAMLCLAAASGGAGVSGFTAGVLDVAPRHSGIVYAFSNIFATLPGIVGVAVTGWLVDVTGTYTSAFALAATISLMGAIGFALLFDATRPID